MVLQLFGGSVLEPTLLKIFVLEGGILTTRRSQGAEGKHKQWKIRSRKVRMFATQN